MNNHLLEENIVKPP